MACARRTLASNFTILSRRFHPSISHLLPLERSRDENNLSSDSRPIRNFHTRSPGIRVRETTALGVHSFPLGFHQSFRSYSSNGSKLTEDFTNALKEESRDLADVLTEKSMEITQVAATSPAIGEVATAAADSAPPVAALQYVIDGVHSFTGLNWWASIILTTLVIRCCTAPLLIHQLKSTTKLALMKPQLEELKEAMQNSAEPHVMQEKQREIKQLFKKHGISPLTPLKGIFIQAPVFISFYLAISNMTIKVPSFKEGGAFWFTDLTTPDPFYALPILTGLSFLATVELNMQEGMEGNPMAGNMKKFSRIIAFVTVPFTAGFPKAIFCYWITSNFFSLMYGRVIKLPQVREFLNLPQVPMASTSVVAKSNDPAGSSWSPPWSLFGSSKQSDNPAGLSSSSAIDYKIQNLEKEVKLRRKGKGKGRNKLKKR